MIKEASVADTQNITTFAKRYKEEKALFTDSEFVENDFRQFILECVYSSDTKVFVSDSDGEIRGFLIMNVDRVPWNRKQKWASDVLFAAEKDAAALIKRGIAWAKTKDCWKIFFSNSTGYPQADKFFQLIGLTKVGGQYEYVL